MQRLTVAFLDEKPNRIVADDIVQSLITLMPLELLKMTPDVGICSNAKSFIIRLGSSWLKRHWSPQKQKCPFRNFPHLFLLRAMIKCFQSNTPAKKEPIFWKRSGQFGSSTYKGSWYHKPWNSPRWSGTVHRESQRTWKLRSRKISELPCPTPFNLTGMQVSRRDLSEATEQVPERQSQDL